MKNEMVPDTNLLLAAVAGKDDDNMQSVIRTQFSRLSIGMNVKLPRHI